MHYADDGFVTVRRALSGFVNSVQKRDFFVLHARGIFVIRNDR